MEDVFRGLKVDIRTGLPIERAQTEREFLEEGKLESDASAGLQAEHLLGTDEGKFFVDLIEKRLETRIDQIVRDDPEASSLLNLLSTLGDKVAAGRGAASRLTKMRLRRENKSLSSEI